MATSILSYDFNDEITTIINRKFARQLKTDDNSIYLTANTNNFNILKDDKKNEIENEENKLDKMSFLFPSVPKEVSIFL